MRMIRTTATALALAIGITGAAQAETFNIFSASKAQEASEAGTFEEARRRHGHRHRHRHGFNPGAAVAIGAIGAIAGAAAYHGSRRYYCDPYYEYCGPRRRVYRYYDGPTYYYPPPRRYYYYD